MIRRLLLFAAMCLLAGTACHPRAGSELWSYRRDGHGSDEVATAVTTAKNGDVYAAGYLDARAWNRVFTVVALTSSGSQRWLVTLDSLNNNDYAHSSIANALACDDAGNVCVTGSFRYKMAVVSLSTSGNVRWVYPSTSDSSTGEGLSIICGADGNIYAAGRSSDTASNTDFTVVSLTPEGDRRWAYRQKGDGAYALAWGPDGNLYVAGDLDSLGFAVLSLRPDGTERWTSGLSPAGGAAVSLAFFDDGSVVAVGSIPTGGLVGGLCAVRYSAEGDRLWTWQRPYGNTWTPVMAAVAADDRGNVYVAGYTADSFTVAGLNKDGQQRWLYVSGSGSSGVDGGQAIAVAPNGEVCCAGSADGVTTTAFGFAGDGSILWSHSLGTLWGKSTVSGMAITPDGNILIAGSSTGFLSDADFVVTCLAPGTGD